MFSSNQVLEISGDLNESGIKNLKAALSYVINASGDKIKNFQIVDDKLIFGWGKVCNQNSPWIKYPFEVNVDILVPIITDFLSKHKPDSYDFSDWDGGTYDGWKLKCCTDIHMLNIGEYGYATFYIEPFGCFYHK